MIYAVFGLPGSGKSYYVVNEFIVKRIDKGTIVSNVKLSDDIDMPENYRYLEKKDMDSLHNNIRIIMENPYTSHDDKKLLLAHLFGLYGDGDITLIVDECHLYGYRGRSTSISYIDDFLSIHRHIFTDRKFDVVLITQVPSRLNTEIANQVEVAVMAIPASQRLITSMLEYLIYGSVDALKKRDKEMRMKRQIIKGDPKVFSFYQSGFVIKGSNDFRKKLGVIVTGVVLLIGYVIYSFMGLTSGEKLVSSDVKQIVKNNDLDMYASVSDKNDTFIDKSYKIVCRTVPLSFYHQNVKDYMYVITGKSNKQICYKKIFKKVKDV